MKLSRRKFLHLAAGVMPLPTVSRIAVAQTYPSRPVRIIVGFAPAGGTDIMARLIAQWLSERLGRSFVIENRPGAGTNIGTEAVVRALPDGYTLLLVTSVNAINATLYGKLNFNFIRDIAPVAGIGREPHVMVVNPLVPTKTVPEFIAYAKANSGPYRGLAPALSDLLGGQVQVTFASMPSSVGYIRTGKLRALAVTTATRSEALPDIPTVAEFVPGYEASGWYGVGAPKGTLVEVIEKLNREINAALADPNMKARLADLGCVALAGSPADFGKVIADETEKWGNVIRALNIKAE
jgi:tripartite-type tricarboxylate transporter receptor subunit TctC